MTPESVYRRNLAQVRANDAAHEAMMQADAKAAGVSLASIRSMGGKRVSNLRDHAFLKMFDAARAKGWKC